MGQLSRSVVRRRIAGLICVVAAVGLAGCGGGSSGSGAAPAAAVTAPLAPPTPDGTLPIGTEVRPGDTTPKAFTEALRKHRAIVAAFVYGDVADEQFVAQTLKAARTSDQGRSASWFVYDVTAKNTFGDLAERLGVSGTPAIVVIGRDGTVVNAWNGLVDPPMLQQALRAAQESPAT
jgi:hypothetical protein